MRIWKDHYDTFRQVTRGTTILIVNYASAVLTIMVFGQIAGRALLVYGTLLPYILVAVALSEGMETAALQRAARQERDGYRVLYWHLAAAGIYGLWCLVIPMPSILTSTEWRSVGWPLLANAAFLIAASGCTALLRAHGYLKVLSRTAIGAAAGLIASAIWLVVHETLTS